jgi:hypothetical protein
VPFPIATIIPFAAWYPTGHCEVESWPGKTRVNGLPLPSFASSGFASGVAATGVGCAVGVVVVGTVVGPSTVGAS